MFPFRSALNPRCSSYEIFFPGMESATECMVRRQTRVLGCTKVIEYRCLFPLESVFREQTRTEEATNGQWSCVFHKIINHREKFLKTTRLSSRNRSLKLRRPHSRSPQGWSRRKHAKLRPLLATQQMLTSRKWLRRENRFKKSTQKTAFGRIATHCQLNLAVNHFARVEARFMANCFLVKHNFYRKIGSPRFPSSRELQSPPSQLNFLCFPRNFLYEAIAK